MLTRIGVPSCMLALAVFCAFFVPRTAAQVATGLRDRVARSVQSASVAGVIVTTDGRDVTLGGNVTKPDDRRRAAAAAATVPGVRTIRNDLMVVEPLDPAGQGLVQPVSRRDTAQATLNALLSKQTVEFEVKRAVVAVPSLPLLDQVARVLKDAPDATVRIEGHTDNFGEPAFNQALSLARAEAVVAYLASQGVSRDRLKAVGVGQERPIASNDTRAGRLKNRRVEIIVN